MKAFQSIVAVGLPLMMLQACAYQRPEEVTAQMARTEATLQQAEQSGAKEAALPELQSARDKYADARKSLDKDSKQGDDNALKLAKQAEVDAQFASAKAQSTRQEKAAQEVRNGVDALRTETQRAPAGTTTEATP